MMQPAAIALTTVAEAGIDRRQVPATHDRARQIDCLGSPPPGLIVGRGRKSRGRGRSPSRPATPSVVCISITRNTVYGNRPRSGDAMGRNMLVADAECLIAIAMPIGRWRGQPFQVIGTARDGPARRDGRWRAWPSLLVGERRNAASLQKATGFAAKGPPVLTATAWHRRWRAGWPCVEAGRRWTSSDHRPAMTALSLAAVRSATATEGQLQHIGGPQLEAVMDQRPSIAQSVGHACPQAISIRCIR